MYILFDIGRTKTRVAYYEGGDGFEEPVIFETSSDFDTQINLFAEKAREVAKGREIKKVAGGMTRALFGGDYENFKQKLSQKLGAEVLVENDSAVVGLGEANFGAGKGFSIVAYITVSTGVGGARIVDGELDERMFGFEPGKQIIDIQDGEAKSLEDLISGKALEEKAGKHPKEILDPNVWEEHAKLLAIGLNNVIVEWSPNVVVLGGSMITGDPAIPLDKTEEYLKEILKVYPEIPVIKKAELGDFGGLFGSISNTKK
jgi:predicted NBD/HSP70 family sugar kinase